jgi:beta-N-acetylglucosaminidase
MEKILTPIVVIWLLMTMVLTFPTQAHANTARVSAALVTPFENKQKVEDNRAEILEKFLESYNSPLASHAKTFVEEADKNHIDWKLVAAISGVESYFGQQIPGYSYNGWGYGVYGNNVRRFASWDDGIAVVSQALRDDYMNKWGATNVYEIGAKYAADPRWANKVQHFLSLMDQFELQEKNETLSLSL